MGAIERVGCGTSLGAKRSYYRFHEVEIGKATRGAKTSEERMNLSTSTIGSMRTRSTSDKRSEDERGTNEPWEVHLELRTEERDKD